LLEHLKKQDPELFNAISQEFKRQVEHLEMIASENYTSYAVMEAQGSVLTNKYAEGLPHKRYYGGCEYVDIAEDLAIKRVKEIFNAEHANVQPHSGSQANQAVYFSQLKAGDTIMGMSLAPLLLSIRSFKSVKSEIKKDNPILLIDAHYFYPDGVAAVILGKLFNLPVVITARGSDINLFPKYYIPRKWIQWRYYLS